MKVKICGIKTYDALSASIDNGADYVGFVNFKKSPRNIALKDLRKLSHFAKGKATRVGVFVNPTIDDLNVYLEEDCFDILQLHGDETLAYIKDIKKITDIKVMKSVAVGDKEPKVKDWEVGKNWGVDYIIFDCLSKKDDSIPGGLGRSFEWSLLKDITLAKNIWCIAGGLNIRNLSKAIKESKANWVDISSGVESKVGQKSTKLITEFLQYAKKL